MFISFNWRGMFPELAMNIITSYLTLYTHGLRNWETSVIKTVTDHRDWITSFNNHPSNICISNLFRSYWFVCLLFLGNTDLKAWSQAHTSPFEVPSGLGRRTRSAEARWLQQGGGHLLWLLSRPASLRALTAARCLSPTPHTSSSRWPPAPFTLPMTSGWTLGLSPANVLYQYHHQISPL